MTRPLRIGVLGLASIARRRMLPAMAACPDLQLTALASRDAHAADKAAAQYGCRAAPDYTALLAMPDIDAVYLPLPAALHATWTRAALDAGKHVLAEKPLTTSAAETRDLLTLAASRGLVLAENVMFLHHAQHATVQRLLHNGAIGELRSFTAQFSIPKLPDDDIRHRPELGGGALADVAVYPLRAALHLLGEDLDVAGAALTYGAGRHVETAGAALLHSTTGTTAHLTFGLDHAYRSWYELCGSTGRIAVDHAFTPPADHTPVVRLTRGMDTEELHLPPDDQVTNTLTAFAAAIRTPRQRPGPGQWREPEAAALRQAELLEAIRDRAAVHHTTAHDTTAHDTTAHDTTVRDAARRPTPDRARADRPHTVRSL
ncbi:Gfo/Idh/MocA family protein [Streptomyces sp. NPDC059152]|uniref:Gfo/Idh/MocA family protein n=1 Tax=Streptomyces sp. NPDC059152 TaxID=3346742 RepID=UPI0036CEC12F